VKDIIFDMGRRNIYGFECFQVVPAGLSNTGKVEDRWITGR